MRHTHILIRAEVRKPLEVPERASKFLKSAIKAAGMNVISGPHSVFGEIPGNEGVSSVAVLDFSSACLHEWPYHKPFALIHFDLYTCGDAPDEAVMTALFDELDPVNVAIKTIDRDMFLLGNLCYIE